MLKHELETDHVTSRLFILNRKSKEQGIESNILLLTSYVSTRARKLVGNAKAYDVKAASSL